MHVVLTYLSAINDQDTCILQKGGWRDRRDKGRNEACLERHEVKIATVLWLSYKLDVAHRQLINYKLHVNVRHQVGTNAVTHSWT